MNRRNFLKGASMLSLGALAACQTKEAVPAEPVINTNKGLGLQTYTLGPELYAGNLSDNLARIRKMGIKNLELAGYNADSHTIGEVNLDDFKKAADDNDLKIVSSHVTPGVLMAGLFQRPGAPAAKPKTFPEMKPEVVEFWKPVAEDHAKLGCQYLVQPMMPPMGVTNVEKAKQFADLLNVSGETVKATSGLQFGYHNHNMEMAKVSETSTASVLGDLFSGLRDGQIIEDLYMDNTDPANVIFELDVYWTVMGQQDPVEWLTNRADRIHMLHIKDRMVLGASGMLNFKNIFDKFYANGRQYFFIEIEDTNSGKQFERLEQSALYLNTSDFVK
ncbi:MAG: sugar phosphate isomerase/epimerase [Bacteroidaceae bacterium]|nr:sugar phosphate isomerase/epimerase [Bacteroidaceae bacterium]